MDVQGLKKERTDEAWLRRSCEISVLNVSRYAVQQTAPHDDYAGTGNPRP